MPIFILTYIFYKINIFGFLTFCIIIKLDLYYCLEYEAHLSKSMRGVLVDVKNAWIIEMLETRSKKSNTSNRPSNAFSLSFVFFEQDERKLICGSGVDILELQQLFDNNEF